MQKLERLAIEGRYQRPDAIYSQSPNLRTWPSTFSLAMPLPLVAASCSTPFRRLLNRGLRAFRRRPCTGLLQAGQTQNAYDQCIDMGAAQHTAHPLSLCSACEGTAKHSANVSETVGRDTHERQRAVSDRQTPAPALGCQAPPQATHTVDPPCRRRARALGCSPCPPKAAP